MEEMIAAIQQGKTSLGIEFGSTRVKRVLLDDKRNPIATGSYDWENQLVDGYWTYHQEEIHKALSACYTSLAKTVEATYHTPLTKIGAIGISAMMHGYLVFDAKDQLLVPFRTWRNTTTQEASTQLTQRFAYQIPQRWSIAHLYQAMLKEEEHLPQVCYDYGCVRICPFSSETIPGNPAPLRSFF